MLEASSPAAEGHAGKIPGWKWGVVWLLFLATMINYMDRQTMASTSSFVIKEFKLDEEGYGKLEYWFGLSFALLQFPAGVLADKLSLRWLYAIALLIWSIAGFSTGLATTFAGLAACRMLLGVGESFNWPCAVAVIRRLMPRESRSTANGIFHAGASIGAMATPLLVYFLVGPGGERWRYVFQITGGAGLLWVVLWLWSIRGERAAEISNSVESAEACHRNDGPSVPFIHIFLYRQFWITLAYGIAINITWHVYRVWLPRLLEKGHGFSQNSSQWVQIGYYICADLGCMYAGYVTQQLAQSRYSIERSRKIVMIATSSICMLSGVLAVMGNPLFLVPLIFIVGAGAMGGFANFYTLAQEISPQHTGKCLGLIGQIVWLILFPLHPFIGSIIDKYHTFVPVFVVVGFIPMIGSILCLFWKEDQTKVEPLVPVAAEA